MGASDFLRKKAEETRAKGADTTRYDEKTGVRLDNGNDSYNTVWENYKRVKASDLAPKVAGGTVNPIISFGDVRENPVLKRKTNTTKTYSQALTESRNKAKVLENGAKLPAVIPPKGDVSKLILPDTGGGGTVNPTLKRNEVRTNYDYMTDREAAVYKYYRDRGQVEKAQEYLDALEMDVNQRAAMQKREDAKKLAEESTAAALYARAVGNIGQAAGAAYALAMEGADKPVDPYHPLMGGVNMNEGLAEGLMGDSTGAEKFAKEAGLAVFDWGTQAATLGPLTPYVMAAGAAAGNTKEALERGGTTDEAVMYGLAGGAAEAITEKLGYDRLLKYGADAIAKKIGAKKIFEIGGKAANKKEIAGFLKSIFPQAGSEAAEEATSEIANILADTLIMGDNSQMKQIAQTAMENGATESEAVKTALQQGFLQVIYSGAVGAASGGVIAGGVGGLSRMTGRNTLEMAGNPVETARDAMTNAGNEVTQRTNAIRSQGKAEVPEGTTQGNVLPEQGNVLSNRENMLPEQGNVMVNRENVPEVTQQNKALRDFGEKYYYTEGQKLVNEEAERRGDTSFIPAFQTYYTAGLTGVKESDIKQTAETIVADKGLLSAAYLAGVNDRKADLEARMKGTGKMGQTAGVFLETDAVTKEQRSLAELVSRVAELEVVLVDELPQDRRGYYENNKGRVTIALNSGQFAGTLFHEATHYLREANPEGYDRMRQAVFSAAAAMKGMDTEAYIKSYEKRYGEAYREAGQEAGYDVILEEMTADMLGELAGDEKSLRAFLEELNRENPTVLGKIREFVESLLKTLKSLVNDGRFSSFSEELKKDIDFTERLAKMLAEETKKAGEKQRGEKTSIKNGKQGFSDINLEADPEVPGTNVRHSYKNDLPLMENITQSKKEDNGKDTESGKRFSLKEPIEETKDLIAVHNLTGEKLRKLLDLQGIPMPSIAITKSNVTSEDFGEISLVFRKDTIDPADKRNKVYDADAWTPMFPMLDKEEYGKARAFLEELVRTMQAQTKSGKNAQGFMGENTMRAAMANRFVSLGEIKEAREKLEHLPKEEFEAMREEMNQRLFGVLEEIYDTGSQTGINAVYEMEDIGEQIQNMAEEAEGVPSPRQIQQSLKKAGYPISMELAEQTARVLEEIKNMPTDLFEAKPERVVDFAEVAAAVVPDDLDQDLRKAVGKKFTQVLEYKAGSQESRVRQLNCVENVRFSIKEDTEGRELSEEQKRFFAESKAVDSQGRLLTLYHQTGNDFTIFEPRRKGAGSSDSETPFGIFMKTSPDDIGLKGKKQMELYANIKNPLEVTDRGDLKEKLKKLSSKYVAVTEEEEKINNEYKQKFEEAKQNLEDYMSEWRKKNPEASRRDIFEDQEYMKRREMESKALSAWENTNAVVENKAKEIITEILEGKGYDGVILKADKGSFGRKTDAYIALHPEQVKRIDNLNPTNDADIRFSIREEAYDALVEENEALKEANEALRRQFEITKDAVHDPVSAKKAVRKWLKAHDSEYDVDDFTEKFVALADYVANAGDRVDFQKVMGALQKLAYDALSESKVLNTDLSDAYKDFKDDVRKTKIKVTEDMAEEFDYYGGYNTVRKENFGKINLSRQGGIYADVFYQELAEKYPGLLDVERISTQVDAVMDILEVVESLQPIYENPYGMNLDEYAMDAAYDLFNMYFDIEMQKPTFADKYEKKIEQMKVENQKMKAAQEKMRNDLKEKYHNRMVDIRRRGEKKLAEEKERSIKRIDQVLREKDRLQRRLETQWEAHRNSMQQADQRELARLMSEGRKTAAKMRKLKEKGDQYKEKLDQMMEEEQEWISAYEELMKEKKAEYRQNLKDMEQRMKEEQRRKLDDARLAAAMHEGRALLEQRRAIYEKLKERDKERRDRAEYAKYKNIIEKEAALLKRWVERPTDQYHVQESMMEGVRNFLEKMKFDDPDLNIMPTDIRRMMKDYQAMTAENTMLYAEEDENVQAMLESLADRVGDGVKVSELGPTEMRQLSVVIRSVSHLVRNANKMVSIKNGEKISTIGNAYMDDVQNKKTKNPDSRLRVLSDMMNVQMLDTESFFKEMGKTVHDTIYRGLREGFDRKILHVKEASEFMQKTVDKKKIREWGEMEPKEYTLSGGKISLTDAQIMSLYCLMRRTQARGHIFGGGIKGEPVVHKVRGQRKIVKNTETVEVTAADVTKLMSNLTEEQKKAALEIQGYLESVASWGNEVTMNMLGYKKFTETNYFPIVTDENYINTMYGARGEKNSTLQTMGITKQTNREAKNPIILENIFDAYVRHIDQMSSYNAFVPALSDLNKFMNYREMVRVVDGKKFGENRSVKETMQRVMGPAGDKYVRDLMERLNNPAVKEDVERLPRIFLRNMKIASVGANLRVIIQQPVSYLRAADEIGVGYLMGALVPSKTDFEKVYEYAPIAQWKEWGNYEMNVGRTMKELLIGQNFYESFLEKSMIAAGIMDKLTWGRIWRAAELEVKKKHPELTGNRYYETVGKRFSEIIDGTQVVDSILHRNQMMRSQSLFSQMATSFMSEPTKTYNMMRNSMVAVMKDNTPENRKKVVRTFMTLVANGVCVAAAAGLVDMLRDDDDDETLLEKWLQAFRGDFTEAESVSDYILAAISSNLGNSFNPLGYIPYMRDIFSVIQGYTVQRTDISWLNDLVKSGKNLMRYMEGDSNYTLNAVLMDAAGSLSKATGIPINSAKRDILAIKNTIVNYTLGLDAQYENKKLTYDVGSEKNVSMYVKMMLEAKMSGNEQVATRIYNDMVNGGISNEKIDNKIKTEQVKAIKEEPEAMEAAKAYNEGRVDDYTRNVEVLAKKGYFMANIESAVESLTKPPTEEDAETFETITKDYWKEGEADEPADYALLFNAYMNGNMADYEKMWSILNAAGKEDNSIRSSMRSRLKSEYWKAKEAGDSQRMQRAAEEFYRLGGKRETLEKAPQ